MLCVFNAKNTKMEIGKGKKGKVLCILFKNRGKTHFQFTKRHYLRIVIFRQTAHYHGI